MPHSDEYEHDSERPKWGVSAIAETVGKNRRQTYYLLETGRLDATKVGRQWVSNRRRLMASLAGREPA